MWLGPPPWMISRMSASIVSVILITLYDKSPLLGLELLQAVVVS